LLVRYTLVACASLVGLAVMARRGRLGKAMGAAAGTLILAQALGDHAALQDAGRRVLRVHIKGDTASGLRRLERTLRD